MAERRSAPEWYTQTGTTRYPFSSRATLVNAAGRVLIEGLFLDAALYPVGAGVGLFLAAVEITHETVTVVVGDPTRRALATGTFALVTPPDLIGLTDAYGRPAGVLVSEAARLSVFQSWGVGRHEFKPAESEFAAAACVPTPEVGLRGVVLEDGSFLTGDVWLVGDDGVVLRADDLTLPATCTTPARSVRSIRLDVVGDPLFRRRLCVPNELFETPRFVKRLRIVGPNQTFTLAPDAAGHVRVAVNNDLAADTVLRLVNTADGLRISAVGSITDAQTGG